MVLLNGLARYLDQQDLGVYREDGSAYESGEVGVCLEFAPPTPEETVTLTSYGGGEADSRLGYDEPRVQIRVRGTQDPRVSRDRAAAIYSTLHGLGPIDLPEGTRLQLAVGVQSGPAYLARDSNGRHEHVLNLRMTVRNPTAHRT